METYLLIIIAIAVIILIAGLVYAWKRWRRVPESEGSGIPRHLINPDANARVTGVDRKLKEKPRIPGGSKFGR
jgi:hypothetical protein